MKKLTDRAAEMTALITDDMMRSDKQRIEMALSLMQFEAAMDGFRIGAASGGKEPRACPEFVEMTEGL